MTSVLWIFVATKPTFVASVPVISVSRGSSIVITVCRLSVVELLGAVMTVSGRIGDALFSRLFSVRKLLTKEVEQMNLVRRFRSVCSAIWNQTTLVSEWEKSVSINPLIRVTGYLTCVFALSSLSTFFAPPIVSG